MSDFAFNNYCIHCDKLCLNNSIYCSDECKSKDSNEHQHSTTTSVLQQTQVSPLLTPALYIQQLQLQQQHNQQHEHQHNHQSQQHFQHFQHINTPLQLSNEKVLDDDELNYFDLNYSVQSNINYTNTNDLINSTSHNYRKWLTTASNLNL
ncbi:hypothetical protein G210_5322 [Candida maltosa Xu316]|uniref:Uncharacterized protein n=1 Tax=Candida maltosa (strain Xu316) TaxID=1245528 RepID=M3HTP5_CANMX|nr:hypothetical protein G210_5322 [Candida maltosa Xu316]